MRFSTTFRLATVLLAPLVVSAAPLPRGTDPDTLLVLQFASVLEQAESTFYKQALSKFQSSDFTSAGFSNPEIAIEQFTIIQSDESTHVSTIEDILIAFGEEAPSGCSFDFSSALTSVSAMLPIARVVENVGVGAYLGAAHLVQDLNVLTDAASIVTVEARHQTMLNLFSDATAISQPFDIPLLPQEVLAIVGGFISGCSLGVQANPALSVTNTGTVTTGTSLQFSSPAFKGSTSGYFCQMLVGGLPFSISLPIDQCVVPQGINGAVAIFITSDNQPLNGNAVQRESNAIVAGPLLTFIDVVDDPVGDLVHPKSGSSSTPPPAAATNLVSSFTSTTTVPPSVASSITSGLTLSTPPPAASATSSASVANGAIANGVSLVPAPTSSA